eukprot:SAG11_NODE_1870_length_4151_cov_2.279368_6_plen_149_part_00
MIGRAVRVTNPFGCQVNAQRTGGFTALHLAANDAVARTLLDHGARRRSPCFVITSRCGLHAHAFLANEQIGCFPSQARIAGCVHIVAAPHSRSAPVAPPSSAQLQAIVLCNPYHAHNRLRHLLRRCMRRRPRRYQSSQQQCGPIRLER